MQSDAIGPAWLRSLLNFMKPRAPYIVICLLSVLVLGTASFAVWGYWQIYGIAGWRDQLYASEGAVASRRALDDFCIRERLTRHDEVLRPATGTGGDLVPRRVVGAPLDGHRHLWPGYGALPREQRETLRRFEADVPGGPATLELAWAACDGERTVEEIARLVWLETGHHTPEGIERFFAWTSRLGLSESTA